MDKIICENNWPLIPDDEYRALCVGHEPNREYMGKIKTYLKFKIESGEYKDEILFMSFPMRGKGKISRNSKYYDNWVKVNGRRPSRNTDMSSRLFVNKYYTIKTRTVKTNWKGEQKSKADWYSVVDEIEEGPPF